MVVLLGLWPSLAAGQQWKTDFSRHTVPLDEIVAVVTRDGIPAIDAPRFVSVRAAARWLDDNEPVAVVRLGGVERVYPLQILIWHEIVNDEVGGIPVSVTYCPLCNTTLAFDRRFDGRLLDFGTTGNLRHSDLVMYDRQTETWWQQATGEGIVGEYAGEQLTFISAPVMHWKVVRETLPDAEVLSRQTGHERPYGRNPYEGYDTRRGPYERFFSARNDDRLPRMERIVALDLPDDPIAVPFSALAARRVITVRAGGEDLVVFWADGAASAVDATAMASSRQVGASAVFRPVVRGRRLSFEPADHGLFRDRETGSAWNLLGDAVGGPLAGASLDAVPHGNHFWFAWAVFRPGTRVVRK